MDEREMPLLSIGEFAGLVGLSSKTLRRYSDAGIIQPARVDEATGYRWYAVAQLGDARLVALLRRLNMPIGPVRAVLDVADVEDRWQRIAAFWSDRRQRLADEERLLERVRQHMAGEGDSRRLGPSALDGLPERPRSEILAAMAEVPLPSGVPVFRQGDVADALYVVASGAVAVLLRVDGFERPVEVAVLGAGELFGEAALLDGAQRAATIVTKEPTTLLRLESETFGELVTAFPEIEEVLRAVTANR